MSRGVWLVDAPGGSAVGGPVGLRPCAVWVTDPPPARRSGLGVLILPPIGYESSSSHRLWRTIAEQLADRGATALRLDYWATGDSAGHATEVTRLDDWGSSVRAAADHLRSLQVDRIAVIGGQLGATLALGHLCELAPIGVVTLAPVLSGRRFVRGLSILGVRAPDDRGVSVGGHYLPAPLLADVVTLRLDLPDDVPVLDAVGPGVAAVMDLPAEEADVAPELVTEIVEWIQALPAEPVAAPVTRPVASTSTVVLREHGSEITEEFVTIGSCALAGVLTTPTHPTDSVYVLVNSGSDPHVGPGRAWVELARHLATQGQATLRVDMRGWGESPDGPTVPGRPYDQHGIDDVVSVVDGLHAQGFTDVVLGGLCAGAWIALAAALRCDVAGSVVLNPQLYWQPGDPVEALLSVTRARRTDEIASIKADAGSGRWDAEDAAGTRPPAARLLDDLARSGGRTTMIFAEGDDGIEYLRDRLARRVAEVTAAGAVRIVEVPAVDHSMQRTWLRPVMFDAIADALSAVTGVEQGVA